MSLRIYCDFDGTIVHEDVGNRFFRQFGGPVAEQAVEGYRSGALNARQCLEAESASVAHVTRGELESFVDGFAVDQTFGGFLRWCDENDATVTVVSDGLDVYVRRILGNAGFDAIPVYANAAAFDPVSQAGLRVTFPYRDEVCESCANCKRNHVVTLSGDDDVVVYVGDGLSDRCAVEYADIVFARGSLIPWCQEKNITYHTFRSFGEVTMRLSSLAGTRGLKQRREAVMARRAVFQRG